MSMSVEAMNALTGMVNDSARTGIASYQASVEDEDRRRKALLARYEMERGYGDRADDIRQQLANGQDMAGQLKTLFGMNKQSADTGATISGIQDITSEPQGTSAVDKLLARVKGKDSYDLAKANVLEQAGQRGVDPMMQAYMVADAEERAKTGNRLDINTFKQKYAQPNLPGEAPDDIQYKQQMDQEAVKQMNVAEEQKMIDAENKKRDSLNMETAKQIKAEQSAKSKSVDPIDILNNAGVQLPANGQWQGSFADQSGHAEQVFGALVNHYASKGDYKTAEKYQREYDANMTSIYKKFGEKWDRKSNRLFEEPKGGGANRGKPRLYDVSTKYRDANGQIVPGIPKTVLLYDDEARDMYGKSARKAMLGAGFSEQALTNNEITILPSKGVAQERKEIEDSATYDQAVKLAQKGLGEYDPETGVAVINGKAFTPPKDFYKTKQIQASLDE